MTLLKKVVAFYNPFCLDVNGREYELVNIIFYKEDGTIMEVGRGWFGDSNEIDRLAIPQVKLRRKEKFDGEFFLISKGKACSSIPTRAGAVPPGLLAVLYIPFNHFDFKEKGAQTLDWGFFKRVHAVYVSQHNHHIYFYHSKSVEVNKSLMAEALKLRKKINELSNQLREMEGRYYNIDPYGHVEEFAAQSARGVAP